MLASRRAQVSFATVQDLMDVRRELMPAVARNKAAEEVQDGFDEAVGGGRRAGGGIGNRP